MHALDATDVKILLALAENPRSSAVALAQALSLSRNTVQARLAALEKRGAFLPFGRRVNPAALGYTLSAYILVHVRQRQLSEVAAQLATIPEVLQADGLTGQADILVHVVSTDAEDLFRINGKVLACDGVERTDTSLAMQELVPFRIEPLLHSTGE